jgi:hypothetical protein
MFLQGKELPLTAFVTTWTYPDVRTINMRDQIESRQHGDETNVDLAKQFLASRRRESDVEIRVFRRETEDFEIVELDYLVLVRDVWLRVEALVCMRHRGFVVAILLRGRRHVDGSAAGSDSGFDTSLGS